MVPPLCELKLGCKAGIEPVSRRFTVSCASQYTTNTVVRTKWSGRQELNLQGC